MQICLTLNPNILIDSIAWTLNFILFMTPVIQASNPDPALNYNCPTSSRRSTEYFLVTLILISYWSIPFVIYFEAVKYNASEYLRVHSSLTPDGQYKTTDITIVLLY